VAEENPPIYICHVAKENPPFWSVCKVEFANVFLILITGRKQKHLPGCKTINIKTIQNFTQIRNIDALTF